MTKGQQLQQDKEILNKKRIHLQKGAEQLKTILEFNFTPLLKSALDELIKHKESFSLAVSVIHKELEEYQKICPHEKEKYVGHCHKWDHYECLECGRDREE